jgi:CspA family cold shock protein
VKRFNAEKGFGFVALADGSPDAFLHISKLNSGNVSPGSRLRVRVTASPRGPEVTEVLSIGEAAPRLLLQGTVKWFDASKGFGFIKSDGSGKEIFISLRVLRQAGLSDLTEGQSVEFETVDAPKGPEARSIRIVSG